MKKMSFYLWNRLRNILSLFLRQSRTFKLGSIALLLIAIFVSSVWHPFVPRPVSSSQPTACWQPDKSSILNNPVASIQSRFLPLNSNYEALSWRLALIDSARERIDVQYYMWHMDEVGLLLLERLLQAADRGIKVRLLLDDLMGGLDREWIIASTHPNMEVRLFNPFKTRESNWWARAPEWLINISRLNHRMHNKLFLVDQKLGIIGGRNIANEYFGLGSQLDYRDFDLLTSGPVAYQLDESFETFWDSVWTYSPRRINTYRADKYDLETFRQTTRTWLSNTEKLNSFFASKALDWKQLMDNENGNFISAPAEVIYDCPPGTRSDIPVQRVVARFRDLLDVTRNELFLVSPYVVLSSSVRDHLYAAIARGVNVRLLTNSLEASDQNITFGAYSKRRDKLLDKGIEIYELDAHGEQWDDYRASQSSGEHLSIHAKLVLFDHDKLMVGSLNLDPRSKYLNTEIALLIHSKKLAHRIMEQFERDLTPKNSWRVQLDENGKKYWVSKHGKFYDEPARSNLQRLQVLLFSFLPIDRQL